MRILLVDLNPFMAPVTPISLGNVGAVLKGEGHEVRILTLGATTRFSLRSLESFLTEYGPRLVGFGTYQRNLFHVRAMAKLVKSLLPETSVMLGGPQATFLPNEALGAMGEVDFLSRGEGELAAKAIAEAVDGQSEGDPISGATTRLDHGQCLDGPEMPVPNDLDGYPSPWLTGLLDPSAIEESIMLTSRGCANHCAFCYTPAAFGGRIRSQSVGRVLEDISWVARHGTGRLWFADPNFSFSEDRVHQILDGILKRDLQVQMWIETRADMLNPELIELLKRAGVHTVAMGLESASSSVYPKLNKGIDPGKIGQAAHDLLQADVDVELFSQYALPGETLRDALSTLEFVKQCGVKIRGNSNAQQMQLYFGSAVYSNLEKFGVIPLRRDLPPYLALGKEFETKWMSRAEIETVRDAWLAHSVDGGKRVVS